MISPPLSRGRGIARRAREYYEEDDPCIAAVHTDQTISIFILYEIKCKKQEEVIFMKYPPNCTHNCRSVFRDSVSPLTKERYTRLWIQMINQIERTTATASGLQ